MTNKLNNVSIIIPGYNEAESIRDVLLRIQDICSDIPHEIIVVDDGSTDETAEAADILGTRVIRNSENLGYGGALKVGIKQAAYDLICITDADGTYPVERIPDLLQIMEDNQADMVVGARPWSRIPPMRKIAKFVIHKFSEFLLEKKVPDMNSGLRIFRRDVFNKYLNIVPDGFSLTSTITLAFSFYGHSIYFEPIEYYDRVGKSKIHPIKDTLNFIQLILRTTLFFNPLKIFLPPSLVLITFGMLLIIVQAIFLQNVTTIAVLIFISGIQILAIGLLADLVNRKTM
jgi:glycosyltransferase involved in cell wall biosynthesis